MAASMATQCIRPTSKSEQMPFMEQKDSTLELQDLQAAKNPRRRLLLQAAARV
ncbi:hypothetical protein [Glycomyces algeriensis]|uniref:hypothetical protein n=1 Tax=Glycomyces algeriensis TaxID=256037 RepID=UPI0022D5B8AA|nr:hypothetical protein [Glycomyces algeriensis]MDA1366177.1 hypothetical protein [Glycomyces algeriensis]MDR7349054.1 hypothetical protein [Glycomyces algeriensis]